MTNDMIVVQWADLTGTGFSPQRLDTDAPESYWAAAEALLNEDLAQPPEGIFDTGGHPIWTLRRVSVGNRRTWCFAVQGRRGQERFGVAGTCRFAFARTDLEAGRAWEQGISATGVRGVRPSQPDKELDQSVREVLHGLYIRQRTIPIALDPADAERVIRSVLGALPEGDARRWSWSTCALYPPTRRNHGVVSGSWPAEFRDLEPDQARAVARFFEVPATTTQEIRLGMDPRMAENLKEVAHQASAGQIDRELRRSSANLAELIAGIGRSSRAASIDDVAERLLLPTGPEKLWEHDRKLLERWGTERPDEAARIVQQISHDGAVREIVRGLLGVRVSRRNLLGLPTAASPGRTLWQETLIGTLRDSYKQRELLKRAREWRSAGVWSDLDDAAAGRWFLRELGLTEHDYPELYRARPSVIVDELNNEHRVTEAVRAELKVDQDPLLLLETQSAVLEPLPAGEAADLITIAYHRSSSTHADVSAVESVAFLFTAAWARGTAAEREGWVAELVYRVEDRVVVGEVLGGGLRALCKQDDTAPHQTLLELCRQLRGNVPLSSETQARILDAERRLAPIRATPAVPAPLGVPAVARVAVLRDDPCDVALEDPPDPGHGPENGTRPRRPRSIGLLRQQIRPWVPIAAGSAVVALVVGAIVVWGEQNHSADLATRSGQRLPSLFQSSTTAAGQQLPPPAPRRFLLAPAQPVSPNYQAALDEEELSEQIAVGEDGQPVAVVLLSDPKGDPARAELLARRLQQDGPLRNVQVVPLRGADPFMAASASPGSLEAIVVYAG